MTKREALRLCRKLWFWLAKNPGVWKGNVPTSVIPDINAFENQCPCCEYDSTARRGKDLGACSLCPLLGLWPSTCMDSDAPYRLWLYARDRQDGAEQARLAMVIADACLDRRKR